MCSIDKPRAEAFFVQGYMFVVDTGGTQAAPGELDSDVFLKLTK